MRVLAADQIRIDERTDVREVIFPDCDDDCLEALEKGIADGTITVERGLLGWGERNATLRDTELGAAYHALIEE